MTARYAHKARGARTARLDKSPRDFWRDLVAASERLTPERPAGLIDGFQHDLIRARGVRFPSGGISAARAALGLVEFGLAFTEAQTDARREQLAPVVVEAAKALGKILAEEATAIAQRSWNRDVD